MADTIGIIFEEKVRPYNAGERAGFPPDKAAEYVRGGLARYANPEDAPAAPGEAEGDREPAPASTHDLTVADVREVVGDLGFEGLQALLESEFNHPDYEGGRKGALEAIRDAIEAVDA